jgi:flagellar hook-length control protein FliK
MTLQTSKPLDPVKAATPAHRPGPRQTGQNSDGGFAQLLKGQTAPPRPAQGPASDDDKAVAQAKARKDKASDEAKTPDASDAAGSPGKPLDQPDEASGQPGWWQALQAQQAEPSEEGNAGSAKDALAALRDAAGPGGKAGPAARAETAADAALAAADTGAAARHGPAKLSTTDLHELMAQDQAGAQPDATADPVAAAPSDGNLPSLGGLLSVPAAVQPNHSLAAAAASTEARLPMPPDHPAFPQALGVQLSTWLRDGVEHARLELNPQDLGPIDVRIAVSGGQTRIDLGADVAATRIALAQAIPQLAEVLGDVGLALSGSSVSAQTGQGGQGAAGSNASTPGRRSEGRGAAARGGLGSLDGLTGASAKPRVTQHHGLLDLYA